MGQGNAIPGRDHPAEGDSLAEFVARVDAFQETIGQLNGRYRELEDRYLEINRQLEATNRRLQQAVDENRRYSEYLGSILQGVDVGVIAADERDVIRFFNPAAERLLGTGGGSAIVGQRFAELFPEIVAAVSPGPGGGTAGEVHRRCLQTGRMLELSVRLLATTSERGTMGAVYVIHDLTAVRETEQELSRLRTLAALGEMSATLAHEIRNPLTGIAGYCGLLLRDSPEGTPRRWAEKIEEGVNRLDGLILHLLEFARAPQLHRRPIHWQPFGQELANAFEDGMLKKRMTLVRRFPQEWPQSVGDPSLLRQAVFNVLQNAEQAAGEGGRVELHITGEDDQIVVEVVDDGPGIDPSHADRIFQPFFTTREQGTGLGLAIARKIVEAHGGTINASSARGHGARVRIALPRTG